MSSLNVDTTGLDIVQFFGTNGQGKTIVITGPSKEGIGAEIATTLAKTKPKALILLGRSESKITPVIDKIKGEDPEIEASFVACDLSDNASVRGAAQEVLAKAGKIDVLVNNAGVMAVRNYTTSADGVEIQFAANHLGHYLLTNLLIGAIIAAKGTVVNMTSSAYMLAEADTRDPNFQNGSTYDPWKAYGRTKTANVLFSVELTTKYKASGLSSFAVDPGMVLGTKLMVNSGVDGELMQKGMAMAVERNGGKELPPHASVNLQQGCATAVWAVLDPSLKGHSPAYLKECAITPTLPYATDSDEATKLWKLSETLVGESFPH